MYKLSNVEVMSVSGQLGMAYGFNITTSHGQPIANFSYRTEAEAQQAAERVASAVQNAIRILAYP